MKKILVCLDLSEISNYVVEEACKFATEMDSALHLVYVSPHRGQINTHVVENLARETSLRMIKENQKMERFENLCKDKGIEADSSILEGGVVDAISGKAMEFEPDFIIIGSQTTNAAVHMIKGSVGAGLLKNLKLPLLLIPQLDSQDE